MFSVEVTAQANALELLQRSLACQYDERVESDAVSFELEEASNHSTTHFLLPGARKRELLGEFHSEFRLKFERKVPPWHHIIFNV